MDKKEIIKGRSLEIMHLGVIVFFVLSIMAVSSAAVFAAAPQSVKNTNINDQAFSVSWTTDSAQQGFIRYGTDPASLDNEKKDDRGASVTDDTHHITVSSLEADTEYYYDIISGGVKYDNGGRHYMATTGPTLGLPASDTIYGQVYKSDGTTPAEGSIVYLALMDKDGQASSGDSQELSGFVDTNGWWNINIGPVRINDLSSYFTYSSSGDIVGIEVQGGADGATSQKVEVDTGADTPVADIVLSQSTVPEVAGTSQAEAEAAIAAASYTIGTVTQQCSDTVAVGDVISQDPVGGTSAAPNSSVDLVVSTGDCPTEVPIVIGQAQAEAEATIVAANFAVGLVTQQYSDTVAAGNVISQDPAAGTSASLGSSIDLVVSRGVHLPSVPNVIGLTQAEAEAAIVAANLAVGTVAQLCNNTVAASNVISQDPTGGTSAALGSSVDLVVSTGVCTAAVPNVVEQSQTDAEAAIVAAKLKVGTVTPQCSDTMAVGNVISQDPTSGTSAVQGSSVDLVVSNGACPVFVPNVVGSSRAEAETAIAAAKLVVGSVTSQCSDTVAEGNVVSTDPASGTSVAPGSSVNLVISTGACPVRVPNVVGMTQADSEAKIVAAKLTVGTISEETNASVAAGEVISQNPAEGILAVVGTAVDLVVSLGPPDYGDAKDPPYLSIDQNQGASHLDFTREWLGDEVDGEADSNQVNADEFDDGVRFEGPFLAGESTDIVITVSVLDSSDTTRYDASDPEKRLYINAWFDWNGDGDWDDADEKVIGTGSGIIHAGYDTDTVAIDPSDFVGVNSDEFSFSVRPSEDWEIGAYARFRLDYGENAGEVQNLSGNLDGYLGTAQFGEVEDYRNLTLARTSMDETGGTIVIADPDGDFDGAEVYVPAGALSGAIDMAVQEIQDSDDYPPPPVGGVAILLEIGPTGTTFGTPCRITIPHDPSLSHSDSPQVYFWDEVAGQWSSEGISNIVYDESSNPHTVTFDVGHLTVFGVALGNPPTPPAVSDNGGGGGGGCFIEAASNEPIATLLLLFIGICLMALARFRS